MAIAGLIGVYNAFFEYRQPALQFSTGSPRDAWHPTLVAKDAPYWAKAPMVCARDEFLSDFEIKPGLVRDVSLCFQPNEAGDIIYYSLMPQEKPSEIVVSGSDGNEYVFPASTTDEVIFAAIRKRLAALDQDDAEAEISRYIAQRVADFSITPVALASIEKELPRIEREAFVAHLTEVLSVAAYFIGGLWLFSFVIGWIVRGFAGIPKGQDFRPALAPDSTG